MTAIPLRVRPRRRSTDRTNVARRVSQLVFAGYIIAMSVLHQLGETTGSVAPSIDALCPFGALETLWTWITTGRFVSMIHPSNLVLGLALLVGVLLAGNAFCGWVCPFGAFQDALTWIRRELHIPGVKLPARADAILRYGRFVVLAIIVYASVSTLKLWFAEYDPYRTLFSLHWLFGFNLATMWPAFVILGVVTIGSLLIERFWCRYLCPLGGVLSVLGHFSILRIRRQEANCKGCALCESPCPVGIKVATADRAVSVNCVGCLACVYACPRDGALTVQLRPTWWDGISRRLSWVSTNTSCPLS